MGNIDVGSDDLLLVDAQCEVATVVFALELVELLL